MSGRWLELTVKIQSIAQAGLQYGKDVYDKERYTELRNIAGEMMSMLTETPVEKVKDVFLNETGYQTPKIDTRAALFKDGKILLVHEKNGKWSLPGGWCDVDKSVAENTEKEVKEEAGVTAKAVKLIAVQDWRKHNVCNYAYGVIKIFVLCENEGGEFEENSETTETGYFGKDEIPENLSAEKNTKEQIMMCFDANEDMSSATMFD